MILFINIMTSITNYVMPLNFKGNVFGQSEIWCGKSLALLALVTAVA